MSDDSYFDSVNYSTWEAPFKLHEDSYRRQLQLEKMKREKQLERDSVEANECTFQPFLAPGSKHRTNENLPSNVFERLDVSGKASRFKKAQAAAERVAQQEAEELSGVTFRPSTAQPLSKEIRCKLKVYSQRPPEERLYSSKPAKVSETPRVASTAVFSADKALQLSRRTCRSQENELRCRMLEQQEYSFQPSLTSYDVPRKRIQVSATPRQRKRSVDTEDNPLHDPEYRRRRDLMLKSRRRSSISSSQRSGSSRPRLETQDFTVGVKRSEVDIGDIVARLTSRRTVSQDDAMRRQLRHALESRVQEEAASLRTSHKTFYEELRNKGMLEVQGVVSVSRKRDHSPRPDSQSELLPAESVPLTEDQKERVRARELAANELLVSRLRRARVPQDDGGDSEQPPIAKSGERKLLIRGGRDYKERITRAQLKATERAREIEKAFSPKPSAVVREKSERGLVTKVQPFEALQHHEELTAQHKEATRAQLLQEESQTKCTFHPITVRGSS